MRLLNRHNIKKVRQETVDDAQRKYRIAKLMLEDKEFQPVREYLQNVQTSAEQKVLDNTIRDVTQEGMLSGIKTIFYTSKKEQVTELSGRYQAMRDFLATLSLWIDSYEQLQEALESKSVEIDG